MNKNSVVFFGVWPNTHKVVVDPVRHRAILYRADAPNGNAIEFDVVKEVFGPIIAFLGLIFFPFILALAPWYAALANHDFYPLLIVYGGVLLGTMCFRIAMRSTFKR